MIAASVNQLCIDRENVIANSHKLYNADEVLSYIDAFVELFERYNTEFERLKVELPNGVRHRHVATVRELAKNAAFREKTECVPFKNDFIGNLLTDESQRPLLDSVYYQSRQMLCDLRDLTNIAHRMESLVEGDSRGEGTSLKIGRASCRERV